MIGDNNFVDDIKTKEEIVNKNVVKSNKASIFFKLCIVFCFCFFLYLILPTIEDENTKLSFQEVVEEECIDTNLTVYQLDENWLGIYYNGLLIAEMKYYDDNVYLSYDARNIEAKNASIRELDPKPEVNEILEELDMDDRLMSFETSDQYLIYYKADIDDSLRKQLHDIFEKVKDKFLYQKGIRIEDMNLDYEYNIAESVKDSFEVKNKEILMELALNKGNVSERERLYLIFSKADCFHEKCEVWKKSNDLISKKQWNNSQLKKDITNEINTQVLKVGYYTVGEDLLPGIYVCIDDNYENKVGFKARKMGFSPKGSTYLRWYQNVIAVLEEGDFINVDEDTKLYHLDNSPQLQTTGYTSGVFYVGKHISKGEYEVEALSDYFPCNYWIVDSSKINEVLSMYENVLFFRQNEYNGHVVKKGKNESLKLKDDQILVLMDGKLKKK